MKFPSILLLTVMVPLAIQALPEPSALPVQTGLPDPLVLSSGERVTTAEQWRTRRVPELREALQAYEYGFLPPPAAVQATVRREDRLAVDGKATLREITLRWGMPEVSIDLLLVTPNGLPKPAPVFLGMNFSGNHAAIADPAVALPGSWMYGGDRYGAMNNRATDAGRGKEADSWSIPLMISRGYGLATFYSGDVVPDDAKLATERLALFRKGAASPSDCATIAAWAWGIMRAVDYLVTVPEVDGKRIAVVGHSRNGKTALLAGALDERIAMIIPSQAGAGGTAPCRVAPELSAPQANGRPTVETVAQINRSFPHWFCHWFKPFGEAPERLPFDQHSLIALCAPRPVLLSNATDDLWANPAGQWDMLKAADPVYRLVSGEGVEGAAMPEEGKLVASRLGYFIRPGKHAMTAVEWAAWLDYADRWLR